MNILRIWVLCMYIREDLILHFLEIVVRHLKAKCLKFEQQQIFEVAYFIFGCNLKLNIRK